MGWEVGQSIYVVIRNGRRGNCYDSVVTRIGRTKGYFSLYGHEESFYLKSGVIDGRQYSSPGTVWPDKTAHENHTQLMETWSYLRQRVPYNVPDGLDLDGIMSVAGMLGIPLPTPTKGQSNDTDN